MRLLHARHPQLGPLFFSTCGESCGVLWSTVRLAADNSCEAVSWPPKLLVAVSSSGTGNRIMTSADGLNWTVRISPGHLGWR